MRNILIIILAATLLSSCFKEEEPWDKGVVKATKVFELGSDYSNQIFYNLSAAEIVSTNKFEIWDLAFYSQDDKFYVKLNEARQMSAYNTASYDFDGITYLDPALEQRFEDPTGLNNPLAIDVEIQASPNDSVMINSFVYIIDRGSDANGTPLGGYKKIVIEKVVNNAYVVRYASLDGSNERTTSILKDPTVNHVAFSFDEINQFPVVEPDRNTWDILFSRFTDTVYTTDGTDFLIGYAVTGAYLNQSFTQAYLETNIPYEEFTSTDLDETRFTNKLNAIGHSWKVFQDVYQIYNYKVYLVKDRNGLIYKMRFLNFYNPENGLKGYPEVEYELL